MDKVVYAVIVAGGRGRRMGAGINKQFLKLNGKPILYYTLMAFSNCSSVDGIILVSTEKDIEYCKSEIIEKYNIKKVKSIVSGGSERQESVYKGLCAAKGCDIVIIHDAVRPFVTREIIENGIKFASEYGACACGVNPTNTIKIKDSNNFSFETPDRNTLFSVQTPQCFKYELIMECHKKLMEDGAAVTDDTMVVERYGYKVYLYNGSYKNIKITTPEDLSFAEIILNEKQ